jgi:hypothetical protein
VSRDGWRGCILKDSYYDDNSRISNSMLSTLADSPEVFYAKYIEQTHIETDTPAMKFGRLFHLMATEPEKIASRYIAAPKLDRRTKEGKEQFARFLEKIGERETVEMEDVLLAELLTRKIWKHDQMIQLVGLPADFEVPVVFELLGVPMKCRPDAVYHGPRIIVDFKTCNDASPEGFKRSITSFGYDRQAWLYREALRQVTDVEYRFIFAAVEKTFPYRVGVYELDETTLNAAQDSVAELLLNYKSRVESGNWATDWTVGRNTLHCPRFNGAESIELILEDGMSLTV